MQLFFGSAEFLFSEIQPNKYKQLTKYKQVNFYYQKSKKMMKDQEKSLEKFK